MCRNRNITTAREWHFETKNIGLEKKWYDVFNVFFPRQNLCRAVFGSNFAISDLVDRHGGLAAEECIAPFFVLFHLMREAFSFAYKHADIYFLRLEKRVL